MRARALVSRVTVTAMALGATTGLMAPPAQAVVCSKAPAQCEAILEKLRRYPEVCDSIPQTRDGSGGGNNGVFCADPDQWTTNLVLHPVYVALSRAEVVLNRLCAVSPSACVE